MSEMKQMDCNVRRKPGWCSCKGISLFRKMLQPPVLTVGTTEDETVSRMTICVSSDDITFEQIKQLNRMVEVIKVIDLSDVPIHMKEIMFAKISKLDAEGKAEIFRIADIFHVNVCDLGVDSLILECKLKEKRNNELIEVLKAQFKHISIVRGGAVAIEAISKESR